MKTKKWLGPLILCCSLFLPCQPLAGSWGPLLCAPVGAREPVLTWKSDPAQLHWQLFQDGKHIADYDWEKDEFHYLGKPPQAPPWGKRPVAPAAEKVQNFGVDLSGLHQGQYYTIGGRQCTRQQAWEAIEKGGQLADDSGKLRLTVIGPEANRKQVLTDLEMSPALAPWKGKLLVQSYAPEHWAVARVGFVTGGQPTIYLQQPEGKVLHRQDSYEGGAEALAEAIRKADPNYKPELDKDKRKADVPPISEWPVWIFVVAALGLGLLLAPQPVE